MTSSYRQVLVHLDASRSSGPRLSIARELARRHRAALAGLYAVMPRALAIPFAPDMSGAALPGLIEMDEQRRDAARKAFDDELRADAGVAATWAEVVQSDVIGAFAAQAMYADLLVLGQPDPHDDTADTAVPPSFVPSVLVQSGRPGLVIPHVGWQRPIGEVIAIAWKPTREAARAVAAALPLLQAARAVHVLTWGEEGPNAIDGTSLSLDGWLQRHEIKASWSRGGPEPREVGELLLSRSFDVGADLLVMGCYGHSRAREWVLGGASRTLLDSMTLPLLMAH